MAELRPFGYIYTPYAKSATLIEVKPEPVIFCRDCKYWQDNNGGYPHEECRWSHEETPDPYDYCSYGESKSGGEPGATEDE